MCSFLSFFFLAHYAPVLTLTDYAQSCARASAANKISRKQKVDLSLNGLPAEAMLRSLWSSEDPLIFGMPEEVLCNEGCSKLNEA